MGTRPQVGGSGAGLRRRAGGPRGRGARAALIAIAFCTFAIALPLPAAAQEAEDQEEDGGEAPDDAPSVDVQELTGILEPGGGLRVLARVRNPTPTVQGGMGLVLTLHSRTTSRFDLHRAVDDGGVGAVVSTLEVDLDAVAARRSALVPLEQTAAELGFARPDERFGLYPMRLQLQRDGEVLDELVTALAVLPTDLGEPLRSALLVPFDAVPSRQPDGSFDEERIVPDLAASGRLQSMIESLDRAGGIPVTVAASGFLLDQVADLGTGYRSGDLERPPESPFPRRARRFLRTFATVAGDRDVEHLALPYGPGDLPALVRADMEGEATRQLGEGRAVVERLSGVPPERGVLWPADGLDEPALDEVVSSEVRAVVLSERYLAIAPDRELASTPAPVRRLRSSGGAEVQVLVPDPWLEELLADGRLHDRSRVLAVQRIVSETAAIFFERPYEPTPRGLLLAPPQLWDPPEGFAGALARALDGVPWIEPVTVSELPDVVDASADTVELHYPLEARNQELPSTYLDDLREARESIASLGRVLEDGDASPEVFDRMLLAAASTHYRRPALAREGRGLLASVNTTVADLYNAVDLVDSPPVILSSLDGQVPVTLSNSADVPIRVRVRMETQRYEFARGPISEPITLEPNGTETRAFGVRALAPGGIHPIRVLVEDVGGTVTLAEGTVVVRSTAVSLSALLVTIAAGVFLLGWWLREFTNRRRQRQPPASVPERTRSEV